MYVRSNVKFEVVVAQIRTQNWFLPTQLRITFAMTVKITGAHKTRITCDLRSKITCALNNTRINYARKLRSPPHSKCKPPARSSGRWRGLLLHDFLNLISCCFARKIHSNNPIRLMILFKTVTLSIFVSVHLSVFPSLHQSMCLSVRYIGVDESVCLCLSVSLSLYLSVSLSLCLPG